MHGQYLSRLARRLRLTGFLAALAFAIFAPGASAEERTTLRIEQSVQRTCAVQPLPDVAAGAASRGWAAPTSGILTARLEGDLTSDWDLALFRDGNPIAASTTFGSLEQASTWVDRGDSVLAQACRRDGNRAELPLSLDLYAIAPPEPSVDRISMESVPVSGADEVQRLEDLGFDVTEDRSATEVTVAVYGAAQRALLASAGFESRTLIEDLVANDAAERRSERLAVAAPRVSGLPTGRESYRVYEDYTTELRDLAEQNPAIAREVNLSPTPETLTIEGRPIEAIEIATDVNRDDDGRPVYLQMGLHHAREWPSGEWPMEFAHTLVQGYNANDARIKSLLEKVRVVIAPVINVDGFIASRSHGTSPLDDNSSATLPLALNNQGAYIRKNCRPTASGDAVIPCADRTGSGVDLNRNYGYYWGGPGSSTNITAQSYRGTGPFSEPESEAVHRYTSTIHPTVFITNHTFTEDGKWLRQPGFDAYFLPQKVIPGYESQGCGPQSDGGLGAYSPDEDAMTELGNAMADATGFTSELGYETLCDITGATEDWNYFAQGTYGYTPEARGSNFHPTYADAVVEEYLGDASHAGLGVREAYLRAGERAANPADHGIIEGTVPPGATLKLSKDFVAPTYDQPALNVSEHLETTLKGPADGTYEWHVNPSDRPSVSGGPSPNPGNEVWAMTCQRPGQGLVSTTVEVARGQRVTVDWARSCGAVSKCRRRAATMIGTAGADRLTGTSGRDVIAALGGRDRVRALGGADIVCGGRGADRLLGGAGADTLVGNKGRDRLRGGAQADLLLGGSGRDRCAGGPGRDRSRACG
jgi:hypothetical protein